MRLTQFGCIGVDGNSRQVVIQGDLPAKDAIENPAAEQLVWSVQIRMGCEKGVVMPSHTHLASSFPRKLK